MDRASNPPATSRPTVVAQISNASERTQVLTLEQTAAYLRISKAHLSNVIRGKVSGVPPLRHVRAGRRVLIKREWADQWLETASQESRHEW